MTCNIEEYYSSFFSLFSDTELFQVYDLEYQRFRKFLGPEGSYVMSKSSIIKGLVSMTRNDMKINDIIVVLYNEMDIDFTNPIFIGSEDAFRL